MKLKFGKYKGQFITDVPRSYLLYLTKEGIAKGALLDAIKAILSGDLIPSTGYSPKSFLSGEPTPSAIKAPVDYMLRTYYTYQESQFLIQVMDKCQLTEEQQIELVGNCFSREEIKTRLLSLLESRTPPK